MSDATTPDKPDAPLAGAEPEPRPKVDVAAVLRALDPFWTRAINETKSLTADEAGPPAESRQ